MKKKITAVLLALTMLGTPAVLGDSADVPFSINAEAASYKKLSKPANFKAKASGNKITLSWSKVSGAEAYAVYKYDSKKEKYVKLKTTTKTKLTVTANGNGTYKFRVYSLDKVSGKYKKGNYSYKSVKISDDIFTKEFDGIKFGMSESALLKKLKGSNYYNMDDMIFRELDSDDDTLAVYIIQDNKLAYYGFAHEDDDDAMEKCCEYYEDNGWTVLIDDMEGEKNGVSYGAYFYIKGDEAAMVFEADEHDMILDVRFSFDLSQTL